MELSIYLPRWFDFLLIGTMLLGIFLPLIFIPRRFIKLVRLLRPLRLIHYGGFAAGGVVMGAVIGSVPLDAYLLFYSVASVLIAFQGAVFLNDIFDAEIDMIAGKQTPFSKGVLSIKGSYVLAAGLSAFSLIVVLPCGPIPFLLLLAAHVVSLVYSIPLIRAKRVYPVNVFLLALTGLAVMVMGFASHAPALEFPVRMLVLVLFTLTATFGTKDMADIAGDRERGIRTLFTLLGEKKGRRVNAALVLVAYLSTPLILAYLPLFLAAAPAAILSALMALLPGNKKLAEGVILATYIFFGLTLLALIAAGEIF